MTRFCLGLACFLGMICPPVMAQETPPDNMDKILARAEDDELFDSWSIDQIEKFAKDFMWRPKCDALERTQFAAAELEAKADHGDKAVEILDKLGASSADPDVKSAAQYDVARVYQRRLKDTDRAVEAYKKVTGRYELMAQRDLVRMWQQAGQAAKAIEYLQAAVAHSKDKGREARPAPPPGATLPGRKPERGRPRRVPADRRRVHPARSRGTQGRCGQAGGRGVREYLGTLEAGPVEGNPGRTAEAEESGACSSTRRGARMRRGSWPTNWTPRGGSATRT